LFSSVFTASFMIHAPVIPHPYPIAANITSAPAALINVVASGVSFHIPAAHATAIAVIPIASANLLAVAMPASLDAVLCD
jgi:hypothetical protein